ncbi:MAG: PIG-L family deacetylase [Anaerolineales bacterium]|nr:PIG-L family deacetylase [Anaerolineales bacterium]
MRILAVGAHPDDVEILCAGTLARYVAQGHHVTMVHACRGDKGHGQILHHEVGMVRDQEAKAAAAVIGAEAMCLDFLDGEIYATEEAMIRFVEMIRITRPDLIITHHPDDYHGDHNAVTKLTLDASFLATLPYYVTAQPPHPLAPPIYFMDTLAGIDFTPTEYVDISATLEMKKEAMTRHNSQITWLKEHHATDILDFIETIARFRGLQCGARYAEGFQSARSWGRIPAKRLLP